ncbi:MAG: YbbR-like domain-containing protein [Ignavibacteria bacterium]
MKKELPIFGIFIFIAFVFWGSITLSEEYTINLSVPIKIFLPTQKFAIEGDVPEKMNIRIRAIGWEIIKLKYFQRPVFELIINEPIENFTFNMNSISNDQLGLSPYAKIISIRPDVIRLNFNMSVEKKIKIYPRLIFTLKEGYDIVSPIKIEPETILIKGSKKVVSKIDSLPTETIQLSELSEFTTIDTKLIDTLSNLITYDKIRVKVSFDVQQIADRDFEKIPITLINAPPNKDIVLFPSFVDVKLRGGISILGALHNDSLKAFVDLKKISSEEEEIIPEFQIPFGVKVVDYFPKHFKLIFRK